MYKQKLKIISGIKADLPLSEQLLREAFKNKQAYKAYSRDKTLLPKLIDYNDYSVIGNND